MTDVMLNRLHLELVPPVLTAAQPTFSAPTAPGTSTSWVAKAVLMDGTIIATYTVLTPPEIVWTLDLYRTATWSMPVETAGLNNLPCTGDTTPPHEVQLFRNGHLIMWGPVTQRIADGTSRQWSYTAADPLWYLLSRNMGQAQRHDYLGGAGQFESGAAGWTKIGTFTGSADGSRFVQGTGSIHISGAAAGGENFYRRQFTVSSGAEGLALFLTAWVYVNSFAAGAFGNRGALIARLGASGAGFQGIATIDGSTPLGSWQRLSAHVNMPPNVTETIEVRLHAWDGDGNWDATTVTILESLSFIDLNSPGGTGWDQVQIAQQTVRYLAGAFPIGGTYTKSDLQLPISGAVSGIPKERTYQFDEHQPGYQGGTGTGALDEWPRSNQGFDYRIDFDSIIKRTFRTYFPAVGHTWTDVEIQGDSPDAHTAFELHNDGHGTGSSWCITNYVNFGETIQGAATDICELGNSPLDSGREEGSFSDDAALGGLTLELVEAAPSGAPIDLLNAVAAQRGSQLAKVIKTPTITIVEPRDKDTQVVLRPLVDRLLPGDLIPVVIDDFSVQFNDVVRVTQVTLNPDDSLTVAIAP